MTVPVTVPAPAQVYEEAFRRIKDATGVSDVTEVIHKIFSQEDQHKQLGELTKENQARIERMAGELKAIKARVEEAKYSGPGGRGGARKAVDVYEERLAAAGTRLERSKDKVWRRSRSRSRSNGCRKALFDLISLGCAARRRGTALHDMCGAD